MYSTYVYNRPIITINSTSLNVHTLKQLNVRYSGEQWSQQYNINNMQAIINSNIWRLFQHLIGQKVKGCHMGI